MRGGGIRDCVAALLLLVAVALSVASCSSSPGTGDEPVDVADVGSDADVSDVADVTETGPDVALDVPDATPDIIEDPDVIDVLDVAPDVVDVTLDVVDVAQDVGGGCETVCFEWNDPSAPEADPAEFPEPSSTSADCNRGGLLAGVCPTGFECSDVGERWYNAWYSHADPVCAGDARDYVLTFDFAPPTAKTTPVSLLFRLNDEPWPTGARGAAGTVVFRAEDGRRTRATIPTTSGGRLSISLAPGVYEVSFEGLDDVDVATYPQIRGTGTLEVVAPGVTQIPVSAGFVRWSVAFSGSTVDSLPAGMSEFRLALFRSDELVISDLREPRDSLTGSFWLYPGRYAVSATSFSLLPSIGSPNGSIDLEEPLEIAPGDDRDVVFDLPTARVSGRLTVGGVPAQAGAIELVRDGGTAARLYPDDAGNFSDWVYTAEYEVVFDGPGRAGLPDGRIVVATGYTPPEFLNLELEVVEVSGEVLLDGVEPPEGVRGYIDYVTPESVSRVRIADTGPAEFRGIVFQGTYDVYVDGTGSVLPGSPQRVNADWEATTEPLVIDLRSNRVNVELTLDGRDASSGESLPAGRLTFFPVDEEGRPITAPGFAAAARSMALVVDLQPGSRPSASVALPPGRFAVRFDGPTIGAMPQGQQLLGQLDVDGPTSETFNVQSTLVTVQLLLGGDWLPPSAGPNRGLVTIGPVSSWMRPNGTSETTFWLARGEYDLTHVCYGGDGCGVPSVPLLSTLATYLQF